LGGLIMGKYIWPTPIKPVGPKVNLSEYRATSRAARDWATAHGVSRIKASKAVADTTRHLVDEEYLSNNYGSGNITRMLQGLTERLRTGDRSGRIRNNGQNWTLKGAATETFGRFVGDNPNTHTIPYGKLPRGTVVKPRVAAARAKAAKYGPRG
jgi:hypothetical protein